MVDNQPGKDDLQALKKRETGTKLPRLQGGKKKKEKKRLGCR